MVRVAWRLLRGRVRGNSAQAGLGWPVGWIGSRLRPDRARTDKPQQQQHDGHLFSSGRSSSSSSQNDGVSAGVAAVVGMAD